MPKAAEINGDRWGGGIEGHTLKQAFCAMGKLETSWQNWGFGWFGVCLRVRLEKQFSPIFGIWVG
jgi:hypothetical protein